MSKATKLLLQYSKKDIVEAIEKSNFLDTDILRHALRYLQEKRLSELQEATEKASKESIEATQDYCAWLKNCAEVYGDGKKCDLAKIPQEVFDRGVQLEKNMKAKYKASRNAHKRLNDFLDSWYYSDGADG